MSTRSKLRSLFGRHKGESDSSGTSSNTQSVRYEGSSPGRAPQTGQRPLSGSDIPDKTDPTRSPSKLRKRSIDRKSHPVTATDAGRSSVDNARKSIDRSPNVNSGTVPSVPAIPASVRNSQPPVLPQLSHGTGDFMTDRENARKSSHIMNYAPGQSQPLTNKGGQYSEDIADWNIIQSHKPDNSEDVPAPLNVGKTDDENATGTSRGVNPQRLSVSNAQQMNGDYANKSLPVPPVAAGMGTPTGTGAVTGTGAATGTEELATSRHMPADKGYLVKDATEAPSLAGVVDLSNTQDTDVKEVWAPAVTHETVNREVQHIREEVIYREIHNHDVYHRILPIIDIEVLPARHFVPTGDGNLMEISESEIPGRSQYNQEWFIGEMVSKLTADSKPSTEPRRFTARQFAEGEGDYKEYISDKGVPTKETTWIHAPVISDYAQLTGQTQPFHFGSENPADDGLRIKAPHGRVIGTSRAYAEEQQQREAPVTPPTESMKDLSLNSYLQGVPSGGLAGYSKDELTPYEKNKRIGHV